jgi:hypothetical protein
MARDLDPYAAGFGTLFVGALVLLCLAIAWVATQGGL